jgi:hypothetical protein
VITTVYLSAVSYRTLKLHSSVTSDLITHIHGAMERYSVVVMLIVARNVPVE